MTGKERPGPALTHGINEPQSEVVCVANSRQLVAFGDVVEREEVDEAEVSQDVDQCACFGQFAGAMRM
jgi:hypothetical protein